MGIYTQTVEKLYVAYFNRPGDPNGVTYWENEFTASGGSDATLANMFTSFYASAEYRTLHPVGQDPEVLINSLYFNLFGRSAEPAGLNYWVQQLMTNGLTLDKIALALVNGAQDKPGGNQDLTVLNNKIAAAAAFTASVDQTSEIVGYKGTAAYDSGRAFLSAVTTTVPNQATIDAAVTTAVTVSQTFALTAGGASFNEGSTATFALATTNVPNGTEVAYTLTGAGIDAADIVGGSLTGKAIVIDGKATISVALANDLLTEVAESIEVRLDNGKASATTVINDTSMTPTYTVTAGGASVNEGASATFTVTADTKVNGTVAYTLTGVNSLDTSTALTGNVTLVDGTGTLTVAMLDDAATEVPADTMTLTVTGGKNASIAVNDTSVTPIMLADAVAGTMVNGFGTAIMTPATIATFRNNDTTSTGAVSTGAVTIDVNQTAVGGTLMMSGDNVVFIGNAGVRQGSFQYSDADISGLKGTVNVTLNSAPTIAAIADQAISEAGTTKITPVGADDDLGDAATLKYTVTQGTYGTVVDNKDGTFSYTHTDTNVYGTDLTLGQVVNDTFTITATDTYGATATQTVKVAVTGTQDATALVVPAPAATAVKSGQTGVTVDLATFATDADTAVASLVFVPGATTAKGGVATLGVDGHTVTINYAQGGGLAALGADTLAFTVGGLAATAALTVTNTAPVATDFALSAKTGVTQTVDLSTYVTDAEANTLTPAVTLGSLSAGGSAEVLAGKLVYTSTIGYVGTETVKYTVTDGFGGTSAEKTITFTVAANTGGTVGDDLLYGSKSAEAIDGLAGNDTINGGGGLDTISGGTGNDRITFNDAAAQIQGGADTDTLVINADAVAIAWDLAKTDTQDRDGNSKNSQSNTPVVRDFENIDATLASGSISLAAIAAVGDAPFAGATIASLAGDSGDVAGTTSVLTGAGADRLSFAVATGGTVTVSSGSGSDQIYVNAGATSKFSIDGGSGDDFITLADNTAANTILGGEGNDTIVNVSAATPDSIDGGAGNDSITGGAAQETLLGGEGDDTISSGGGNDSIVGGNGNDSLTAGSGADSLFGGEGNDTLVADGGTDYMDGGNGSNTYTMAGNLATTSTIIGGTGTDTVSLTGHDGATPLVLASYTKISSIESFDITATNNKNVVVTAADYVGLTNITINENATTAKTNSITGMTAGASLTLVSSVDNKTIGATTVALTTAGGTTDALAVNLKGAAASTTAGNVVDSLVLTGYESVTIDSGSVTTALTTALGNQNIVTTIDAANLATLTLTGASALTISGITANAAASVVNAKDMTGALSYTTDYASVVSITGGSDNDTIAFGTTGTLLNTDSVDGGAGTADVVTATVNGTTATTGALRISNVETVTLAVGGASTVDTTAITGADLVAFTGASALTVTGISATQPIGLGSAGTAFTGTSTFTLANATGSADALNLKLNTTAAQSTGAITTANIETINITQNAVATGTQVVDVSLSTAATINVTSTLANGGSQIISLGTLNAAANLVDASGDVDTGGKFYATSANATAATLKGSSGANSLTGGTGNDTITIATAYTVGDTVAGGAGTDILNATFTAAQGAMDFTNVSAVETINLTVGTGLAIVVADSGATGTTGLLDATTTTINVLGTTGSFTAIAEALGTGAKFTAGTGTFDASGFAGTVEITQDRTGFIAGNVLKGGSGSTDVLHVQGSTSTFGAVTVSGFETFEFAGTAGNSSFDMTNVTGVTNLLLTGTMSQTVTNLAAGVAVSLGASAALATNSIADTVADGKTFTIGRIAASTSGTADALTVNLNDEAAITNGITLVANGIENLTFNQTTVTGKNFSLAVNDTNATNAVTMTFAGGFATAGTNTTTFRSGGIESNVTVINAAGSSDNFVMASGSRVGTSAMTITGGTGADTIVMKNVADVLDAGTHSTGGDTLVLAYAAIAGGVVDLTSTTDQVTLANGLANAAVQKGFENLDVSGYTGGAIDVTAATGGSKVTGSDGADVIRLGAGVDTVAYSAASQFVNADTISNFTAHTDAIQVAGSLLGDGNTTLVFAAAATLTSTKEIAVATTAIADNAAIVTQIQACTQTTPSLFVVYNTAAGESQLWYDANANVDGGEILVAHLVGVSAANLGTLAAADFTLV